MGSLLRRARRQALALARLLFALSLLVGPGGGAGLAARDLGASATLLSRSASGGALAPTLARLRWSAVDLAAQGRAWPGVAAGRAAASGLAGLAAS
ncbi:MAG TPA: hypothetical protein VGL23_11375, partial [Chloroflexota bacterium]